jgi:hypothetical protein
MDILKYQGELEKWKAEQADKDLVYTPGQSKLNPDTGQLETTQPQVYNKRTGEYSTPQSKTIGDNKLSDSIAILTKVIADPNASAKDKADAQAFIDEHKDKLGKNNG